MRYTQISLLLIISTALLLTSCYTQTRVALPKHHAGKAEIPGMPGVRDWGGMYSDVFQEDLVNAIEQYIKSKLNGHKYGDDTINVLLLSGGASKGAFAAGILNGWDFSDSRPTFTIVTGISAGALIAPFAFLGDKYDEKIGIISTSISKDDVMKIRSLFSILLGSPSVADSAPLANLIAQHIDEDMLKDIAKAHFEGRRLYIGTTNLDAQRLVIWNMGAIASSRHPKSLELFRKVILASSSIPVAFPPVMIEVEAGGATYDEMHVDGGVATEVFSLGFIADFKEAYKTHGITKGPKVRLFIILNKQIETQYKEVDLSILGIAQNALSSLTTTQGVGDLYRIYTIAQREGVDYNLAIIPGDFIPNPSERFDPHDMKRLYELGYDLAKSGYPWEKYPPFLKQ